MSTSKNNTKSTQGSKTAAPASVSKAAPSGKTTAAATSSAAQAKTAPKSVECGGDDQDCGGTFFDTLESGTGFDTAALARPEVLAGGTVSATAKSSSASSTSSASDTKKKAAVQTKRGERATSSSKTSDSKKNDKEPEAAGASEKSKSQEENEESGGESSSKKKKERHHHSRHHHSRHRDSKDKKDSDKETDGEKEKCSDVHITTPVIHTPVATTPPVKITADTATSAEGDAVGSTPATPKFDKASDCPPTPESRGESSEGGKGKDKDKVKPKDDVIMHTPTPMQEDEDDQPFAVEVEVAPKKKPQPRKQPVPTKKPEADSISSTKKVDAPVTTVKAKPVEPVAAATATVHTPTIPAEVTPLAKAAPVKLVPPPTPVKPERSSLAASAVPETKKGEDEEMGESSASSKVTPMNAEDNRKRAVAGDSGCSTTSKKQKSSEEGDTGKQSSKQHPATSANQIVLSSDSETGKGKGKQQLEKKKKVEIEEEKEKKKEKDEEEETEKEKEPPKKSPQGKRKRQQDSSSSSSASSGEGSSSSSYSSGSSSSSGSDAGKRKKKQQQSAQKKKQQQQAQKKKKQQQPSKRKAAKKPEKKKQKTEEKKEDKEDSEENEVVEIKDGDDEESSKKSNSASKNTKKKSSSSGSGGSSKGKKRASSSSARSKGKSSGGGSKKRGSSAASSSKRGDQDADAPLKDSATSVRQVAERFCTEVVQLLDSAVREDVDVLMKVISNQEQNSIIWRICNLVNAYRNDDLELMITCYSLLVNKTVPNMKDRWVLFMLRAIFGRVCLYCGSGLCTFKQLSCFHDQPDTIVMMCATCSAEQLKSESRLKDCVSYQLTQKVLSTIPSVKWMRGVRAITLYVAFMAREHECKEKDLPDYPPAPAATASTSSSVTPSKSPSRRDGEGDDAAGANTGEDESGAPVATATTTATAVAEFSGTDTSSSSGGAQNPHQKLAAILKEIVMDKNIIITGANSLSGGASKTSAACAQNEAEMSAASTLPFTMNCCDEIATSLHVAICDALPAVIKCCGIASKIVIRQLVFSYAKHRKLAFNFRTPVYAKTLATFCTMCARVEALGQIMAENKISHLHTVILDSMSKVISTRIKMAKDFRDFVLCRGKYDEIATDGASSSSTQAGGRKSSSSSSSSSSTTTTTGESAVGTAPGEWRPKTNAGIGLEHVTIPGTENVPLLSNHEAHRRTVTAIISPFLQVLRILRSNLDEAVMVDALAMVQYELVCEATINGWCDWERPKVLKEQFANYHVREKVNVDDVTSMKESTEKFVKSAKLNGYKIDAPDEEEEGGEEAGDQQQQEEPKEKKGKDGENETAKEKEKEKDKKEDEEEEEEEGEADEKDGSGDE